MSETIVDIVLKILLLVFLGALTVLAVRILILPGLNVISHNLKLKSKTRGQILGYATSLPELVVVLSAAWAGVFDAGFWNIASSNIINWVLFLLAVIVYKQYGDLKERSFLDEILFGLFSVALPVVFFLLDLQQSIWLAAALLGIFVIYRILDNVLNRNVTHGHDAEPEDEQRRSTLVGVLLILAGIVVIIFTGKYLGSYAEELVVTLSVPVWAVGWILGFITSIPEMSGFFEIYRYHKKKGTLKRVDDTQEALDALVSSNMSNLGIILPVGIFLLAIL